MLLENTTILPIRQASNNLSTAFEQMLFPENDAGQNSPIADARIAPVSDIAILSRANAGRTVHHFTHSTVTSRQGFLASLEIAGIKYATSGIESFEEMARKDCRGDSDHLRRMGLALSGKILAGIEILTT